ncbi:MAG: pimeloyl-ACP methyl ester carboxylesterase [Candidatus Azotimanducaceae bacterium]|jgi:pimeloyl-ACP methyl ester carboxylesterase
MQDNNISSERVFYGVDIIPESIRSRMIEEVNGLSIHILEAGYEDGLSKPCIVLLHGFPELAFSYRAQLKALADAGYYVIAPDQRGYGYTTGWDNTYTNNIAPFGMFNLAQDIVTLVVRLGVKSVHGIVGHDFGSPVAAWCALIRPDLFKSLVLMSAPFGGPPSLSSSKTENPRGRPLSMDGSLASLSSARIHYQTYYSTEAANKEMLTAEQGLIEFLCGYYFLKSGVFSGNKPFPLSGWSAEQLAKLPRYYVMDLGKTMPETVANMMLEAMPTGMPRWLSEDVVSVYAETYQRTGFQGGLNWYRCSISTEFNQELRIFAGRKIEVPAIFIAGQADWGIHQSPGQLKKMLEKACTDMTILPFIDNAGHWVQQEQPEVVNGLLVNFFHRQA